MESFMKKLFLMMILVMSVGHNLGSEKTIVCDYEQEIISNKKVDTKKSVKKRPLLVSEKKSSDFNLKKVEIFVDIDLDVKNLYYRDPSYFEPWGVHVKDAANKPCFFNCTYSSSDWRTDRDGALKLIQLITEDAPNEEVFINHMMRIEDEKERDNIIRERISLQAADISDFLQLDASFNEITKEFEDLKTRFASIPLPLLADASNNFKRKGDILFAFTQKIDGSDVEFEIKLATDTSHKNFTELIENFCKDTPKILEKERSNLAKAEIITVTERWINSPVIIINHGANSIAGRLNQQEQQKKLAAQREEKRKEEDKKRQEEAARIYFIKRCCAVGLSLAAIISFLYYKFSTNNQKII